MARENVLPLGFLDRSGPVARPKQIGRPGLKPGASRPAHRTGSSLFRKIATK